MSLKNSGRRIDLRRLEIELENAEAADVLHEAQELRGAPQLGLPFLAAVDQVVQGLGERIELIAAALGRRLRVGVMGELLAQLRDAGGEAVRHRERDRREHDEHVEGEEAEGEAMIGAHRREPGGRADDERGRHRDGEQLGANRPTAHASSNDGRAPCVSRLSAGFGGA